MRNEILRRFDVMNIKRILILKGYLSKMYLWITVTIILIVTAFAVTIYLNIERAVLENEYENNKKLLYQIKFNIDYMDKSIKDLCMYVYFNNDVQAIMYFNDSTDDFYDLVRKMDRIKKSMVDTNSMVHSIYIYNNTNKTYYSTYKEMIYHDSYLDNTIRSYKAVPKIKPIYRKIEAIDSINGKKYDNILSYFMYDSIDPENRFNGAIIVNVKLEWVFDNIKAISMADKSEYNKFFILDDKGDFIGDTIDNKEFMQAIKNAYTSQINSLEAGGGVDGYVNFFKISDNKKDYITSYIKIGNANWTLFNVKPYDAVYTYINQLKNVIIIITLIFLLITFVTAATVSIKIYKPINTLVKKVNSLKLKKTDILYLKDEMSYLNDFFNYSIEQENKYRTERISNNELLKILFLRTLILESDSISKSQFDNYTKEYNVPLNSDEKFVLCMFKIDDYKHFFNNFDTEDKELYKFNIMNIANELISKHFNNQAIDMKNDIIIFILNSSAEKSIYKELAPTLRQIQKYVLNNYKISLSIAISEKLENVNFISGGYTATLNYMQYRYVYGKMSVITPGMVKRNKEKRDLGLFFELENKLMEEIKGAKLVNIENMFLKLLIEIEKMNYDSILFCKIHLINAVKNTIEVMNQLRLEPYYESSIFVNENILELDTIDEFYSNIMSYLYHVVEDKDRINNEKHIILIESIKKLISNNYSYQNFCLQEIASILKMSPAYIGRVFKENSGISIPEYLNKYRLNKATELLEKTKLNINEINEKVGIENLSYFYVLFKKEYGITPKEYILKKALNNNQCDIQ